MKYTPQRFGMEQIASVFDETRRIEMTLSHVFEMMGDIKSGDRIYFNSYGACDNTSQLGRKPSATIPATGTVERVYPRYAVVKLKVARECVLWDGIIRVNGVSWPLCTEGRN